MRDIIVVRDPLVSDGRSGSHPANNVFEPSSQALVDGQVRAYGSVAILAASALLNYETIMQAAVATRRLRGPAPEACRHVIGRCHVVLHGRSAVTPAASTVN